MALPDDQVHNSNGGRYAANVEALTVMSVLLRERQVLVDRILAGCLRDDPAPAQNTSVRLPGGLHGAALAAVGAGAAGSLSEIIVAGVRLRLLELAEAAGDETQIADIRAALEEHYTEVPDARPSLFEIVNAAAVMENHPAAESPSLVAEAIEDLGEDADVEDVLAWVRGALAQRNRVTR